MNNMIDRGWRPGLVRRVSIAVVLICFCGTPERAAAQGLTKATPPPNRRDFVRELCEPQETAYHWMDVRLKAETSGDARFAIYVFSDRPVTTGWNDLNGISRNVGGWVILDAQGVPVSDPLQILQVLQTAQTLCIANCDAATGYLMSPALPDDPLLETVRRDHQNVLRRIFQGLAAGDPLWDAWDTITGKDWKTRRREKACEAYRRALLVLLPRVFVGCPEMAGAQDAINRVSDGVAVQSLEAFEEGLKEQIEEFAELLQKMNVKGPGAGRLLGDWIKPDEDFKLEWAERASLPIGTLVPPPWASTGVGLGERIPPPLVIVHVPRSPAISTSMFPACERAPGYLNRLRRYQSQERFIKGVKAVRWGALALRGVTVAAAILRAYQTQAALEWNNDELLQLAAGLRARSGAGPDADVLGEAIPLALADERAVVQRIIDAVNAGLQPEVWSLVSEPALQQLLKLTGPNTHLQLAMCTGVTIGFAAAKEAFKLQGVDDALKICIAFSCIEETAVACYNRTLADARTWTATSPPDPQTAANILWLQRMAWGARGCFYRALHELISDTDNLSNAAQILLRTQDWLDKVAQLRHQADQYLARANMPFPNESDSLTARAMLLPKYRSFLPGTGPRLDGVWRGKVYYRTSPSSEPTIYGDTIAYLYSREDGSCEGRLFTWWNPSWPSDKQPPPDPRNADYDGVVGIQGRCVWNGKVYFSVVKSSGHRFWTEDRGWTGQLSADGTELTGQHVCGLPFTLKRTEPATTPDAGLLDVVVLIDKSGSMVDDIECVQREVDTMLGEMAALAQQEKISLQVGVVMFSYTGTANVLEVCRLSEDIESTRQFVKKLNPQAVGGDEDLYSALMYAMNETVEGQQIDMGWRTGAAKITIPITDEAPKNDNFTVVQVARVAKDLDPVHMYPLITPRSALAWLAPAENSLNELARLTGGQAVKVQDAAALPRAVVEAVKLAIRRHKEEIYRKDNPPYVLYGVAGSMGLVLVIFVTGMLLRHRTRPPAPATTVAPAIDPELTGDTAFRPPAE